MRKYILIICLLTSSLSAYPRCSSDLAPAVQAIYRFPEGRQLLEQVEKEGPLRVYMDRFNSQSGAMWVGCDRSIVINANHKRSYGEKLRSILFELHNAKTDKTFEYYDQRAERGEISRAEYIETIEWLEYQNARNTADLICKAIQQGYFPRESYWPIASDFHAHLEMQKYSGHSAQIAAIYDAITHSREYGSTCQTIQNSRS
ncbi:MAG: hypothetical protein S4CHLAM2_01340 [Chlamydiales bacterium]|nr:hypothetical protein [Chlamydiales bacterium]